MKKNDGHTRDEVRFARAEQRALATVAFVLTDAMESSGLSQRQLAEQMGVSEARISQVLNATGNPTIKTLARVAEALKRRLNVDFAKVSVVEGHRHLGSPIATYFSEQPFGCVPASGGVVSSFQIIDEISAQRIKRHWTTRDPDPMPPSPEIHRVAI